MGDQLFVELARELQEQGLAKKVIADMFGMALRTYQEKLWRLSGLSSQPRATVREVMLDLLRERGSATRQELLDEVDVDEATARSVLRDLRESGLVVHTGRGSATTYRAQPCAETPRDASERLAVVVWWLLERGGPRNAAELEQCLAVPRDELQAALDGLMSSGRVSTTEDSDSPIYQCAVVPNFTAAASGLEAALCAHLGAVIESIVHRVHHPVDAEPPGGGGTYSFIVWPGHPLYDDVTSLLADSKQRCPSLHRRVHAHNADRPIPTDGDLCEVQFYCGQVASVPAPELPPLAEPATL